VIDDAKRAKTGVCAEEKSDERWRKRVCECVWCDVAVVDLQFPLMFDRNNKQTPRCGCGFFIALVCDTPAAPPK
jgi:hypothetical protein